MIRGRGLISLGIWIRQTALSCCSDPLLYYEHWEFSAWFLCAANAFKSYKCNRQLGTTLNWATAWGIFIIIRLKREKYGWEYHALKKPDFSIRLQISSKCVRIVCWINKAQQQQLNYRPVAMNFVSFKRLRYFISIVNLICMKFTFELVRNMQSIQMLKV